MNGETEFLIYTTASHQVSLRAGLTAFVFLLSKKPSEIEVIKFTPQNTCLYDFAGKKTFINSHAELDELFEKMKCHETTKGSKLAPWESKCDRIIPKKIEGDVTWGDHILKPLSGDS